MKIDELATTLKPKGEVKEGVIVPEMTPLGPVTRPDRLLSPSPLTICFPHTPGNRSFRHRSSQAALDDALEAMEKEDREGKVGGFDGLFYDPVARTYRRFLSARRPDAHLGAIEL